MSKLYVYQARAYIGPDYFKRELIPDQTFSFEEDDCEGVLDTIDSIYRRYAPEYPPGTVFGLSLIDKTDS